MNFELGGVFEADVMEGNVTTRRVISTEYAPADGTCMKTIMACSYHDYLPVVWMLMFSRNASGYCLLQRDRSLERVLIENQEERVRAVMTKLFRYFRLTRYAWRDFLAGTF